MSKRQPWEYSLAEKIKYHVLSLFGENSDSWLNESIDHSPILHDNAKCTLLLSDVQFYRNQVYNGKSRCEQGKLKRLKLSVPQTIILEALPFIHFVKRNIPKMLNGIRFIGHSVVLGLIASEIIKS